MSKDYIYLGWRHRHSETTPYVQVRGIEKGGGLRRIPFIEYTISQLLDEAKKIFYPRGKSGHAKAQKLEFCECSLGIPGSPLSLQDVDLSISRYLSDNVILHIGDSKKSFVLEFCRHEISHYTSEATIME